MPFPLYQGISTLVAATMLASLTRPVLADEAPSENTPRTDLSSSTTSPNVAETLEQAANPTIFR